MCRQNEAIYKAYEATTKLIDKSINWEDCVGIYYYFFYSCFVALLLCYIILLFYCLRSIIPSAIVSLVALFS